MAFKMKYSSPLHLINEGKGDNTKKDGGRLSEAEAAAVSANPDMEVTGTLTRQPGKVSTEDKNYFEGVNKYISNKPSGSVDGANLRQSLMKNDLPGAVKAMRNMQNNNPGTFKKLNDIGKYRSGSDKGFRFSNEPQTVTGKLDKDGTKRKDKKFDPNTQITTYENYEFK